MNSNHLQIKVFCLFFLFAIHSGFAQKQLISGKIVNERGEPLSFCSIADAEKGIGVYADGEGFFQMEVPFLPYKMRISMIGYRSKDYVFESSKEQNIILDEESLRLKGVVVLATPQKSFQGTSAYTIGDQAIKQIQALSLNEVLSLLPGRKITTPNLTKVGQANLRIATSDVGNAFATAIIVDGNRLSNDANMQAENPAEGLSSGKATTGSGIDLREIPATDIEAVEVVSGVPSVRYGNVAAGAIIVKTKVYAHDWIASASVNATNYQASLSKGFRLNENNLLNVNLVGTYADESPTEKKDYYQSVYFKTHWKTSIWKQKKWTNTVRLMANYSFNGQRFEKEDVFKNEKKLSSWKTNIGIDGSLSFLQKTTYSFNLNVGEQYSYFKNIENNGPLPLSQSTVAGTFQVAYSPFVYTLEKNIYGLPLNIQSRIENIQIYSKKMLNFVFTSGLEYSYDKNKGKGRIGNGGVVSSIGSLGSRDVYFYEVPATEILSAYHETKAELNFSPVISANSVLGLRFDRMYKRYHLLSPRVSFEAVFFNKIRLKTAYGISYKAPAMIQLYPGPSFIDFVNLDFFAENPLERMAVISTFKHQHKNLNLKPIKGETFEIGTEIESKWGSLNLVLFKKTLKGSISSSPELIILPKQKYIVTKRYPDRMPDIVAVAEEAKHIVQTINRMKNTNSSETWGLEFTLFPKKIMKTNTEFNVRFSLLSTIQKNNAYKMQAQQYSIANKEVRYGVYFNTPIKYLSAMGSLTIVQHIPDLKLIFTLTTELNFFNYRYFLKQDLYPRGYYDYNGNYKALSSEEVKKPAFRDLKLPESTYQENKGAPFYPNLHLQIRKEIKGGHTFNFFANNALWYNPHYYINDIRITLNEVISFGMGITFKL